MAGVCRVDEPEVTSGPQRCDRPRGPQAWLRVGMLQLQELHGPFHVGNATGTEFGVLGRVGAARQPFGLNASLELTDLGQLGGCQSSLRPATCIDLGEQLIAEILVTSQRVRPDEGLQLPGGRPPAVVVAVRGQRSDQGTALALWPKVSIDAEPGIDTGP